MHRTLIVSLLITTATAAADPERPAPRRLAARATVDGDSLGVVTFSRGSARVRDTALDRVEDIAEWQADHPDSMLIIEGYAVREGSWNKSLRISQQRTDAVREALVEAGADPARIVLVARGDRGATARAKPRVVIRASGAFVELAREQRDPEIGEDARAARRTFNDTARRDTSDTARGRNVGASGTTGGSTVVIVPGANSAGTPTTGQGGATGEEPTPTNPAGAAPSGADGGR